MTRTVEHPVCAPCLCVLPSLTELNEFHGHSTPTAHRPLLCFPLSHSRHCLHLCLHLRKRVSFFLYVYHLSSQTIAAGLTCPIIITHTHSHTYIYIYCHAHCAQMIKGFLTDRHQSEILLQFSIGLSWAAEGDSQEWAGEKGPEGKEGAVAREWGLAFNLRAFYLCWHCWPYQYAKLFPRAEKTFD